MTKEQFKQKLENFWYYYKIHTIVAIFLLVSVAIIIKQCSSRVVPDLNVIIAVKSITVSHEQADSISNTLSKLTEDVNKDGRKVVNCELLDMSTDNPQAESAYQMKFTAELASSNTALYITDDSFFSQVGDQEGLFYNLKRYNLPNGYTVKLSKLPDFKKGGLPSELGDLNLSMRKLEGPSLEKASVPYYKNSENVFKKLLKNGGLLK